MKPAILSKFLTPAILIFITLASACGITTPVPVLTTETALPPSATPTDTPTPPLPSATPSPVPSDTQPPLSPTETPAPDSEVTWAEGLEIQERDIKVWGEAWSPTGDELVGFIHDEYKEQNTRLVRFAAPDFQPQEILAAAPRTLQGLEQCISTNLLWSPDGKRVFFGGPVKDNYSFESCSLWMVEHDGSSPRLYQPEQTGRWLGIGHWIRDHILVMSGYREGIRLFDLITGETVNWAQPAYLGYSRTTRDYFVGSEGLSSSFKMYALGPRDEPVTEGQKDFSDPMKFARTPPEDPDCQCPGRTLLYDVLPGSNKVLAYFYSERVDDKNPQDIKILPIHKLVLWDIDQNTLSTLVPYANWGKISPDQRILAYLTSGPAFLDAEKKPVDPFITHQAIPYWPAQIENPYLQLLDLDTGTVFLSVPVASLKDEYYEDYIHVGANFSPNGRFLSFTTDRQILLDEKNWPEMVQPGLSDERGGRLYVLDLENRRLIMDQSEFAPMPQGTGYETTFKSFLAQWSPRGDQFIYLDTQNNPILVNVETGEERPISIKMSSTPTIEWSSSGKYVSIRINDSTKIAFVKIP